jgi:hypothetical protein
MGPVGDSHVRIGRAGLIGVAAALVAIVVYAAALG